ncbi:MAG: glycosyltransferase, partial [Kiloniellaceae bacterium]
MSGAVELSVVVPVTERFDDVDALYGAYKRGVEATGQSFEFIYVLDGNYPDVLTALQALRARGEPIRILTLARWFGEATALTIGFTHARGEVILTLPAYRQVEPGEIARAVAALEGEDMVIARRYPRRDTGLNVLQSNVFHSLLRRLAGTGFHDL